MTSRQIAGGIAVVLGVLLVVAGIARRDFVATSGGAIILLGGGLLVGIRTTRG
jgi:hypothetical protein